MSFYQGAAMGGAAASYVSGGAAAAAGAGVWAIEALKNKTVVG